MSNINFEEAFGKLYIDDSHCFICSVPLDKSNTSKEHIFPKWLLKEFELYNEKLEILNLTKIPYRQLTIPCCKSCNNGAMSNVENDIKYAVSKGIDEVKKLPEQLVVSWLLKISLGLLVKQSYLKNSLSKSNEKNILDHDDLKDFSTATMIMRSFYNQVQFSKPAWSLFIIDIGEKNAHYNFVDLIFMESIMMVVGEIGFILIYNESGIIKDELELNEKMKSISNRQLNRGEISQFFCRLVDKKDRAIYSTNYQMVSTVKGEIESIHPYKSFINGYNRDFSYKDFAYLLERVIYGTLTGKLYVEEEDGHLNFLPEYSDNI